MKHGEIRSIKFEGERSAILNNVAIRIGKDYKPAIHLDSDEANAVFAGDSAEII
ncbi:MAG: hypothetical protein LBG88_02865 [Christensenellaceae bacterium]|nr:hypothetical protein [Christensenellaceae bacterium]